MTDLIKIKEIAKSNPEGFTIRLPKLEEVTAGIVVAYLETQNCFDDEGLKKVVQHAEQHDNVMGGWLNEENNRYYFDSCKVFTDRIEAIRFGKENQQIAIFDLDNLEIIKL